MADMLQSVRASGTRLLAGSSPAPSSRTPSAPAASSAAPKPRKLDYDSGLRIADVEWECASEYQYRDMDGQYIHLPLYVPFNYTSQIPNEKMPESPLINQIRDFFWMQKVARFWTTHHTLLILLNIIVVLGILFSISSFHSQNSLPYATISLCVFLLVWITMNAVPLLPYTTYFAMYNTTMSSMLTPSFGTVTICIMATLLVASVMVPVMLTMYSNELNLFNGGESSTNVLGSALITYDPLTLFIRTFGSLCVVIIPFIIALSFLFWDTNTVPSTQLPFNPQMHDKKMTLRTLQRALNEKVGSATMKRMTGVINHVLKT
jgi:hypothetical protein